MNVRIIYHHRTRFTDAQRIHIMELVRGLRALEHDVRIVSLVTENNGDDVSRDAGNPWWQRLVWRIPFTYEVVQLGYNLLGIPMLLFQMLSNSAEFIYERYSLFNFTGVLVAKLCRVPLVLEVNSPFALEQSRDNNIRLRGFAQWAETRICKWATRVIVVSTPLKRILIQAGVPADKIEVMMNGVRLETFAHQPAPHRLRSLLGLQRGTRIIGFVGWFRNWHGIDLLLDAFRMSGAAKHGVKVMLVGDGQAMPDLRRHVQINRMESDVIFTGPLPHNDVPEYLSLIDIAVQPAANDYCCPMKILEYMALGKPIVAPRQENIQELLRDKEEALFFTPGDVKSLAEALKTLINDSVAAQRIGQRAQEAIVRRGLLWNDNARRVVEMISIPGMTKPSEKMYQHIRQR